jgi:hypothetical protein
MRPFCGGVGLGSQREVVSDMVSVWVRFRTRWILIKAALQFLLVGAPLVLWSQEGFHSFSFCLDVI